jgi:hypothetical protein
MWLQPYGASVTSFVLQATSLISVDSNFMSQTMTSKLSLGFIWVTSLLRTQEPSGICEALDRSIPDRTSYPTSQNYIGALSSYYSGQESELKPQCIFTPTDASEVSRFVTLITADVLDGQNVSLPAQFAVRSGGHAVFSGAANVDGGITVDLRALNSLVLSEDCKTATIGAGAIWSEIYSQLVPYNVTVMGGRVAGVGAGGFLTGGGLRVCLLYYPVLLFEQLI